MKTPLAVLIALFLLPSAASAATVDADVERRQGTFFGPVTFKAAKGEANRLYAWVARGSLIFHDSDNAVMARGDCVQVSVHRARCPVTEDTATVKLRDRRDKIYAGARMKVLGGASNDLLVGSSGADDLNGQRGADKLRGSAGGDRLTGGPGRDWVKGGDGDDDLIDGETDAQAVRDVYRAGRSSAGAGADRGDAIDYSKRKDDLVVRLSGTAPSGDILSGIDSVIGGSGNDRLIGDEGDNWLVGGGGNDFLRGRGADDNLQGGRGDDTLRGDDGADVLWGQAGPDLLQGDAGDDTIVARDSHAEDVRCGAGEDTALPTPLDTLEDCETASSRALAVTTQPAVQGGTATYAVACLREGGCSGTLTLRSLTGEDYGSGDFSGLPHGADVFSPVEVELTPAGRGALNRGEVIVVTHGADEGYRAFTRGSPPQPSS